MNAAIIVVQVGELALNVHIARPDVCHDSRLMTHDMTCTTVMKSSSTWDFSEELFLSPAALRGYTSTGTIVPVPFFDLKRYSLAFFNMINATRIIQRPNAEHKCKYLYTHM